MLGMPDPSRLPGETDPPYWYRYFCTMKQWLDADCGPGTFDRLLAEVQHKAAVQENAQRIAAKEMNQGEAQARADDWIARNAHHWSE